MTNSGKPTSWFIIVLVLLFGIGAAGGGIYLTATTLVEVLHSEKTNGTVVGIVEVNTPRQPPGANRPNMQGRPAGNKTSYAPLVSYQAHGKTWQIRGNVSSSIPSYSVGELVPIRYLKERPGEGRIDSFSENWLAAIIVTIFGLIFTLAGGTMFRARIGRQASREKNEVT